MTVGIMITGLILIGLSAGVTKLVKRSRSALSKENIPPRLGILEHIPMEPLLGKLTNSLDDDFVHQVKERLLQENPKLTEDEFEWRMFELKRYFFLSNLLKTTPMFSQEVDEVWH